jgi:hypothetical protein
MRKHYSVHEVENDYMGSYGEDIQVLKEEVVSQGPDAPYIETEVTLKVKFRKYNAEYGDDKICKCGHSYYRHFDSYEGMAPVGCKYCPCDEFIPEDAQ